jgi:predicted ATP-dependent serine protease|tara:strand:+ start:79823 stop:80020 length:198 start_codon:yes stop_codon:yes gene_type:complete
MPKWTCAKCGAENNIYDSRCSNCDQVRASGQAFNNGATSVGSALRQAIDDAKADAMKSLKKPPGA